MAKIDLKFLDSLDENAFIKVNSNTVSNEIDVSGKNVKGDKFSIFLDKSTAIKFAKTLRTEINKIK